MDSNDLVYLSVLERYGKTGEIGYGLLQNFGLNGGAVGSSGATMLTMWLSQANLQRT